MIEPISPANAAEADAFLARAPYENVYLQWLIGSGATVHQGRTICFLSRADGGAVDGVCYFGAQFVPSTQSDAALHAFADLARTMPAARMIVGPRAQVQRWWEILKPWHRAPRVTRDSQPLYVVNRETLRGSREDADVGLATLAELDEIARESAAMIEHESGIDPRASNPNFRSRTARIIGAGWWWRWRAQGTLRFQCNIGSQTALTAQIQGVWTPPAQRRRGYATLALGATCDQLLDRLPSLCLYVNDFNEPAVALYKRLGFTRAGEFTTYLF